MNLSTIEESKQSQYYTEIKELAGEEFAQLII